MTHTTIHSLFNEEIFSTKRCCGLLLHPTSLPGNYGLGDFGPYIFRFIDFLSKIGINLWQILPLGPTGYGNSPYQLFSTYAGNPLLISPEKLQSLGLLELQNPPRFSKSRIEYGKVIPYRWNLLKDAYETYCRNPYSLQSRFEAFKQTQSFWLEDYSLYMSIKEVFDYKPWNEWDEPLKFQKKTKLKTWKHNYAKEIEFHNFVQFLFFFQWGAVKEYANQKNIMVVGDIPIFTAYDSAEVWAYPEFFSLDDQRELMYVAGVPPDYFSEIGQRWGNPLYRNDWGKKNGYHWWVQRIKHCFSLVNILRIDHFRGFESYWQIPADEPTAIIGKWVVGPGIDLFITLKEKLGQLPIIAENLGIITSDVEELLKQTGFPGMRVLQFAFGNTKKSFVENDYLPHNYVPNTVVYTGTHDNDTTASWFNTINEKTQNEVLEYLNSDGEDVVGDLIRLCWSSVARFSIIPLQDLLRLGNEGRMNHPGTESGNWEWRFTWEQITEEKREEIIKLNRIYQRGNFEQ
ncbi:MAG: 4-alpha-glucanotransferase [Candidatus Hodarchaeota archaeon]